MAKQQFVVIIKDYTDEGALERRMKAREAHLAHARESHPSYIMCGGAILDSHENGKMIGSAMIVQAESEEELRRKIEADPYVIGKAWEKWEIYPYRNAIGLEKELSA